ncbi:MAG: hypothetical protein KF762_04960 [Acidobacteria bacterium]|nr:hypothetical protein [Acidobacteriota bacterium]
MKSVIPALVSCLFVSVILLVAPGHAVFSQVPEIENAIPNNMPLKIEIIAPEKAEDYPDKIRIKVTNTGDRSIVWLRLHLEEINEEVRIAPDGKRAYVTMPLIFGRRDYNLAKTLETDPVIAPAASHMFDLSYYKRRKVARRRNKVNYQPVQLYRLGFSGVRYLDGSGYFSNGQGFSKKN